MMKHSVLILLVLAVIGSLVFSGCGSGGGSDAPKNIAYIYQTDSAEGQLYKTFLDTNNYVVDLIDKATLTTSTDLSKYSLIIIAGDYLVVNQSEIDILNAAGKPFIGIGAAGLRCFSKIAGLSICSNNQASGGSITSIFVVDATNPVWTQPNNLAVSNNSEVVLYNPSCPTGVVHSSFADGDVVQIGKVINGYLVLTLEANRYFTWGFTGSQSTLTDNGKKLFLNVVKRMAQ